MMKTLTIFIAALFVFNFGSAQVLSMNDTTRDTSSDKLSDNREKKEERVQLGSLKGPEAKNHPTWRYKSSKVVVTRPSSVKRKLGPDAKNHKVWQDTTSKVPVTKVEKKDLKGPRAKNYKPWKKK